MTKRIALLAVLACCLPATVYAEPSADSLDQWTVKGNGLRLFARCFRSNKVSASPVLVVVLHGDAPFNPPGYQYDVARKIAAAAPDVIVAALLRPGYTDPHGNHSEGERGQTVGDNWNAKNTDTIGEAIGELRKMFHARRVVVAGHSGGAALTANLLGRHPDVPVDAAVLAACPCDVEKWRESMFKLTGFAGFQGKIETLSPMDSVDSLPVKTPIVMLIGTEDKVAVTALSEVYRDAALKAGKSVRLILLPGKDHEIFEEKEVIDEIVRLVQE